MASTTTGLLIVLLLPLDMMADTHKFSAGGISSMSGLFWWLRLYNNCSGDKDKGCKDALVAHICGL